MRKKDSYITKKIKVTVKTPPNQAEKSVKSQRDVLLGFKVADNIIKSEVLDHNLFYWIIKIETANQERTVIQKVTAGSIIIKKFYRKLFKMIDKGNKLMLKFKKGYKWVKSYLLRKMKKEGYKEEDSFYKQVEEMTEEEIKDFLHIEDREEMEEFLEQDLVEIDWNYKE